MPLTKSNLPQYRQLYEQLKQSIQDGSYAPGDLLPSENELCRTHELTRPTVRQSLGELVRDGYIKKVRGKGSIVQQPKTGIGILNIRGTTDSLPAGRLRTRVIDSPVARPWPQETDFPLSCEDRDGGSVYLSRLRLLDDRPVFYEETFLPAGHLPGFTDHDFNDRSLFGLLLKFYNLRITGGRQRIRAIKARGRPCELLGVKSGTPIVYLNKRYETSRPDFHFYTSVWCQTEHHYLEGAL